MTQQDSSIKQILTSEDSKNAALEMARGWMPTHRTFKAGEYGPRRVMAKEVENAVIVQQVPGGEWKAMDALQFKREYRPLRKDDEE